MLLALPRLMGWSDLVTMLLTAMTIGTLVYSLLTHYELGAYQVLPMEWHLGLDFASGAFLIAMGLILGHEAASVRAILAAFGAFEVVAAMLSDSASPAALQPRGAEAQARARQ
jgi:hypothetical protein